MAKNILEAQSLTKIFGAGENAISAVDEVSLNLAAGELAIILGPSGSGKTTILSMIGGLLKPTSGAVSVGEEQITSLSGAKLARFRREKIGFIFQTFNLIPYISALGNVLVIQHINGELSKKTRDKAIDLLKNLGLENRVNHLPFELSGGERQRVAIARAFMNDPEVILADEPTANLDTLRGEQIVCMLQEQIKSRQKAGIMVTHDERMCKYADRIFNIVDGRLKE